MFEYLKGLLVHAFPHKVVVDVSGVGYQLHISIATFNQLPPIGGSVCLYTSLVVREDSHRLFGFLQAEERDCFDSLNGISGIGPKLSLAILGHIRVEDLHACVAQGDTNRLTHVPGVGKKMAQRLILELKDRCGPLSLLALSQASSMPKNLAADAVGALINLGYRAVEAQRVVDQMLSDWGEEQAPSLAQVLSLALKSRHLVK